VTTPSAARLAALVVLPLLFAATSADAVDDASSRGPLAVTTLEFADLVDTNRKGPVADAKKARGASGRRVPIKVHLPAGDRPVPVVLVSHGAGGDWDTHLGQALHLASHGYAVLCLEHVGSNRAMVAGSLQLMKIMAKLTAAGLEPFLRGGVTDVEVLAK